MRIIGGKYRGKKLYSPQDETIRPTSDKTREAIFNILRSRLGYDFSNLSLLDIFCGSGAFSLEAISQGFKESTAIDIDTKLIKKNISLFSAEKDKIKIISADAQNIPNLHKQFDVIFMDAPYNKGLTIPALIQATKFLKNNTLCIIETHKSEKLILPNSYEFIEERKYGISKITFATSKA
jgi:16S rRNA (guanine966-N2)-methyltransferase